VARTEVLKVRVEPETAARVRAMVGHYGSANAFVNLAIIEKLDHLDRKRESDEVGKRRRRR